MALRPRSRGARAREEVYVAIGFDERASGFRVRSDRLGIGDVFVVIFASRRRNVSLLFAVRGGRARERGESGARAGLSFLLDEAVQLESGNYPAPGIMQLLR